jgi:hypothetical protein
MRSCLKKPKRAGNPSYLGGLDWEDFSLRPAQDRGVAQAVEHLPHKHEFLSSNSSMARKEKKVQMTKRSKPLPFSVYKLRIFIFVIIIELYFSTYKCKC